MSASQCLAVRQLVIWFTATPNGGEILAQVRTTQRAMEVGEITEVEGNKKTA